MDQQSSSLGINARKFLIFNGLSAYLACATIEWAWGEWQSIASTLELSMAFYGWFGGAICSLILPRFLFFRIVQIFGFLSFTLIYQRAWGFNPGNYLFIIISIILLLSRKWSFKVTEYSAVISFLGFSIFDTVKYFLSYKSEYTFFSPELFQLPLFIAFEHTIEIGICGLALVLVQRGRDFPLSGILLLLVGVLHSLIYGNGVFANFAIYIPVISLLIAA